MLTVTPRVAPVVLLYGQRLLLSLYWGTTGCDVNPLALIPPSSAHLSVCLVCLSLSHTTTHMHHESINPSLSSLLYQHPLSSKLKQMQDHWTLETVKLRVSPVTAVEQGNCEIKGSSCHFSRTMQTEIKGSSYYCCRILQTEHMGYSCHCSRTLETVELRVPPVTAVEHWRL